MEPSKSKILWLGQPPGLSTDPFKVRLESLGFEVFSPPHQPSTEVSEVDFKRWFSSEVKVVFISERDVPWVRDWADRIRSFYTLRKRGIPLFWIESKGSTMAVDTLVSMGLDDFLCKGDDGEVIKVRLAMRIRESENRSTLEQRFREQSVQLAQSDVILKQREEFLGVAAHDLRSPLGLIQTSLSIVLESKDAESFNPMHRELIERARRQSLHAVNLVNDLLDVMSLEQGLKPQYQLLNLNQLLQEFYRDYKLQAEQKKIQFHYENPVPNYRVFLDSDRVRQLLQNLFTNALKFTEPGKNIYLSVKSFMGRRKTDPPYPMVVISLKDEGKGIPGSEIQKIFDRFTQLKDSSRAQGRGLGLSVAKQISNLHDGNIWAESQERKGSTFFVLLPHVVSQVQAPQRYGTEKTRVLVAEPNTQRRKQYFRNLSDWGYEVIFARDGVEALTLLFYHWPDIVILTMGLKKLDTKDVTGIIKKDPAASRIPVLLAAEKTETLEKSLNASVADGSLALPFLHEVFKTSVATARKLKTVSAPKKAA